MAYRLRAIMIYSQQWQNPPMENCMIDTVCLMNQNKRNTTATTAFLHLGKTMRMHVSQLVDYLRSIFYATICRTEHQTNLVCSEHLAKLLGSQNLRRCMQGLKRKEHTMFSYVVNYQDTRQWVARPRRRFQQSCGPLESTRPYRVLFIRTYVAPL